MPLTRAPISELPSNERTMTKYSIYMDISLYNASLLTIIGIITGTSLGLTGLGSILTVPLLIYAGMTPHETVATVLALHVFPQALPGLYLYYKKGHLRLIKSLFVIIGYCYVHCVL